MDLLNDGFLSASSSPEANSICNRKRIVTLTDLANML
jgi:hypothetical protein